MRLCLFEETYPKLLLDGAGVGLWVQAVHVVVDGAKLTGGDCGIATQTCFKYGIVDENVLLLQKQHPHCESVRFLKPMTMHCVCFVNSGRKSVTFP